MEPITIKEERVLRALVAYARSEVSYYNAQHLSGLVANEWYPLCERAGLPTRRPVVDENDFKEIAGFVPVESQ